MKKFISLLFICFMCVTLTVPCFAMSFENPPIIDDAGYLYQSQQDELSEKLENIRQEYDFDVAIVTEYEMSGYSAESTADEIYDYMGYGAGPDADGILLYICAEEREYHITTHAYGLQVFNQNGINHLKDCIEPYLKDDDYYLAMNAFADASEELLEMADNGEYYDEESESVALERKKKEKTYSLIVIGCAAVIPLLIAFILMFIKLSKMKTAVSNNYAANYIKPGSHNLTVSRDIFIYSRVTKIARPKPGSSSGVHRSSSGRTHGGGGGKF